jgi:hypothetical protein
MLTPEQMAVLKADILADPILAAFPMHSDGAWAIAVLYNLAAAPEWTVWKTDVDPEDIMRNGMDWTRVDNLSVGKARIWDWMTKLGTFNAAKANIRSGIDAVWVGTTADLAVRAMVYTHCKREATRIEKLFSTGTGTTEAPATMTFEGQIQYQDVLLARNLP